MIRFISRRVLASIPVLLVVTAVVFAMVDLMPGDPAIRLAGEDASPDRIAYIRQSLGLDEPLLSRYLEWLMSGLQGDLGRSLQTRESVSTVLVDHLTVTASLVLVTLVFALLLGLVLGVVAAAKKGSWADRFLTFAFAVGMSLPPFWISLLLVVFVATKTGILPAVGYSDFSESPQEWLRHLILPAAALSALPAAELGLQVRDSLIAELRKDYVLVARAKGMSRTRAIVRHALKNSAVPVSTVFGYRATQLLGGTVTVEVVFVMPGLGATAVAAVQSRDVPVLLGLVVLMTLIVVVINLVTDVFYGVLNPKVRSLR